MSENLDNFLVDLAVDPDRRTAFFANPDREVAGTMLTAEEKAAVLSRADARIRRALGLASGSAILAVLKKGKKKGKKKGGTKKKGGGKRPASKRK